MFRQYKSFMTKRYFPRSKQVIFILGIIVISIVTGFFGSFFTSITQRDYFVNSNENDIINILQSGVKSPIVSYIPSNYLNVLEKINGIRAISPEVHSLVLIDQTPVTLHGITNSFFELNSSITIAGENLNYIVNSNRTDAIIAGYEIATALHLQVGTTYQLYSSNVNSFGFFYLAGIIRFNNFNDEDLFTTVNVASYFRSQDSTLYYSMIRIKIDTSIISKDQINAYLSQRFLLTVNLQSHYKDSNLLSNKNIKIFLSNGVLAGSNKTGASGSCSFLLPIGIYDMYIYANANTFNDSFIFLNSTSKSYNVDPFTSLSNLTDLYNLSINSFYNNSLFSSTSLQITSPYGPTYYYSNNPDYQFFNIPAGLYYVKVSDGNVNYDKSFNLNSNFNLSFYFNQMVHFILKNLTNTILSNFSCSILDYRTNLTNNYSSCPGFLSLEKSIYNVTLRSDLNHSISFNLPINPSGPTQNITTYIGLGTQLFEIQNASNSALPNVTVFARQMADKAFTKIGLTNSTGFISFPFEFGKGYDLLFSKNSINASISFHPTNISSIIIYQPFKSFNFTSTFLNGNDFNSPIKNISVNLLTADGNSTDFLTNNYGSMSFNSSFMFSGQLTITYKNTTKIFPIDTSQQKTYNFTLGMIDLNLNVRSYDNLIIPNLNITVESLSFRISFINSNGSINLLLPTNNEYNFLTKNYISANEFNFTSFLSDFVLNNLFKVSLSFNQTISIFYLTRTYAYSSFSDLVQLPYYFTISFTIQDSYGVYIPNAQITLNQHSNNYVIITNSYGQADIRISPGTYFITIQYTDYQFNYNITINQNQVSSIQLPIFISKIKVSFFKPNLSALSGKQYLDEFYNTSISYFLQIFTILIIIVVIILVLLFSSVVKLTLESLEDEIFVLNILGTSKYEMFINLLYNFQIRSLLSSIIGLGIGMFLTQYLNFFSHIQILGFIFYSQFDIFYFTLFLVSVNLIIFIVLINMLRNMKIIYPIHLLRHL